MRTSDVHFTPTRVTAVEHISSTAARASAVSVDRILLVHRDTERIEYVSVDLMLSCYRTED